MSLNIKILMEYIKENCKKFLEYFPLAMLDEQTFSIKYSFAELISVEVNKNNNNIKVYYSEALVDVVAQAFNYKNQFNSTVDNGENHLDYSLFGSKIFLRSKIFEFVSKNLKTHSVYSIRNQFFIPAGRSFFRYIDVIYFRF